VSRQVAKQKDKKKKNNSANQHPSDNPMHSAPMILLVLASLFLTSRLFAQRQLRRAIQSVTMPLAQCGVLGR
jgi:hypothetical protein